MGHFSAVAALWLMAMAPLTAAAQLRPLEPLDWRAFEPGASVRAALGVGAFAGQRVALAGVRGDLLELGDVRITVRTGRVLLEVAGTPQRFLRAERFIEPPTGDARAMSAKRARHDAGDYRITTAVALSDPADGSFETLRFGTRLPTTDNKVGLDRDQTDFFALLGAQRRWSRLRFAGEAGVSINGTRRPEYEQSDVLAFNVSFGYDTGALEPAIVLTGQNDLRSERTRGNEDLAELRAVVRAGGRRWLQLGVVAGIAEFSPRWGVMIGGGVQLGRER